MRAGDARGAAPASSDRGEVDLEDGLARASGSTGPAGAIATIGDGFAQAMLAPALADADARYWEPEVVSDALVAGPLLAWRALCLGPGRWSTGPDDAALLAEVFTADAVLAPFAPFAPNSGAAEVLGPGIARHTGVAPDSGSKRKTGVRTVPQQRSSPGSWE